MLATLKNYLFIHKKKSLITALISGIVISYCLYSHLHTKKMLPQDVKVVEVEPAQVKNIQQTAEFIGTIKSEQATTLIAKSGGILDRFVNSGQKVKKGDLIAKIENPDLERNFKLSQDMEHIAKLQFERYNQLYKTGVISKNTMEEKKTDWMEYQKKMSDAKIAMDENTIEAPFNGIIGIFKIREGSQVQAGDLLVTLYDPSSTIVEFDVPMSVVNSIQDGNVVYINNKQYQLTYIQKMLDEETHMSPAYTRIECNNCIIGSAVDVDVVINQKQNVITIPYEAVFLSKGKTFVYVMKDSKATLTPVELGLRQKELVEITAGLKANDPIITRGQARLYPGAAVKLAANRKENAQDNKIAEVAHR